MTRDMKNDLLKWMIGVAMSVMLGLLGLQVNIMQQMNQNMIDWMKDNTQQHGVLNAKISEVNDFVHPIYEYEIKDNTRFRKEYEPRMDSMFKN